MRFSINDHWLYQLLGYGISVRLRGALVPVEHQCYLLEQPLTLRIVVFKTFDVDVHHKEQLRVHLRAPGIYLTLENFKFALQANKEALANGAGRVPIILLHLQKCQFLGTLAFLHHLLFFQLHFQINILFIELLRVYPAQNATMLVLFQQISFEQIKLLSEPVLETWRSILVILPPGTAPVHGRVAVAHNIIKITKETLRKSPGVHHGQDVPVGAHHGLQEIACREGRVGQEEAVGEVPESHFEVADIEIIREMKHVLRQVLLHLWLALALQLNEEIAAHECKHIKWYIFGPIEQRKVVALLVGPDVPLLDTAQVSVLLHGRDMPNVPLESTVHLLFLLYTEFEKVVYVYCTNGMLLSGGLIHGCLFLEVEGDEALELSVLLHQLRQALDGLQLPLLRIQVPLIDPLARQ